MKRLLNIRPALSKEVATFLGLTLLSIAALMAFVDLQPKVDQNFFFSSEDPHFKSETAISEEFVRKDSQIIISVAGAIETPGYYDKISRLTERIRRVGLVNGVKSIGNGPRDLEDARQSPMWRRLLLSEDGRSTNLIVVVDEAASVDVVRAIERIAEDFSADDFRIKISGQPYIVELIRRNLSRDFKAFSSIAFAVFGIVIFLIFRSKSILTGTMIACINACIWTLMITNGLRIPIGILTANLATIVFIITLSHIVFLTFNWKRVQGGPSSGVEEAVRITFAASFWSMLTTLLGFASLLLVPAKPLRELGAAGAIGTLVAIASAYSVYPAFLRMTKPHEATGKKIGRLKQRIFRFFDEEAATIRLLLGLLLLLTLPGLFFINKDPSILSYFAPKSEIHEGLAYIDQNGGSSPLILVVRTDDAHPLDSQEGYERLWDLQSAIEKHDAVGSVISLPVLMAEARQEPLASLLFWSWLLNILEQPAHDRIAQSFVSADRKSGLFLLRMYETQRTRTRLTIIDEIEHIVEAHGFVPEAVGGVYKLQGHLASLTASSVVIGLAELIAVFAVIGWLIARSWRIAGAMIASIAMIPLILLGAVGLLRIPLDVISSPAATVSIAMGIDAMIHMVKSFRRKKARHASKNAGELWTEVVRELRQPVLTSALVIGLGFGIFAFSTFPPTQRFGLEIVFGTLTAAMTALYVMPRLAIWQPRPGRLHLNL